MAASCLVTARGRTLLSAQKDRQLGEVRRQPPRLVPGEQLGRRAPAGLARRRIWVEGISRMIHSLSRANSRRQIARRAGDPALRVITRRSSVTQQSPVSSPTATGCWCCAHPGATFTLRLYFRTRVD